MLWAWWEKRARCTPYFCDLSSFACLPSLQLYIWRVSSSRATMASSPVSSKSREVIAVPELPDLNFWARCQCIATDTDMHWSLPSLAGRSI
jgi:hypothetical protein